MTMFKDTIYIKKADIPEQFPQGWKKKAAEAIGIHPFSVSRILRNPKNPNYDRLMEAARSIYGKAEAL
ncbi:MAG: hypothetical protein LBV74_01280 [Tannerella sp.]|jgi:hypothetical protein|nr:hypothetical protein [Tannerella sp.]